MIEVKPPNDFEIWTDFLSEKTSIFLAGSIEMGSAINWQKQIVETLKDFDIIILNPRRDDWDSSWKQSITNPKFVEQVNWELDGLEKADIIFMYFDPNTKAPITLLELGTVKEKNKVIVCCPNGFWRKGNVDIFCYRNKIPVFSTFELALFHLTDLIN